MVMRMVISSYIQDKLTRDRGGGLDKKLTEAFECGPPLN